MVRIYNLFLFGVCSRIIDRGESFITNLDGINPKTYDNFVCPPNEVESTKFQCISEMQCVFSCFLNRNCKSVFFHQGNAVCVMCKNSYLVTSSLQVHQGMKYFRSSKASTCADWASLNGVVNGTFPTEVDPDGFELEFDEVTVPCDLDTEPGKAFTVLNHNRGARTRVKGYDQCNSYRVTLTYDLEFEVVKNIVDASTACKQYIKYECHNSAVFTNTGIGCIAWETRLEELAAYYTGNGSSTYYCDCEQTGTCSAPNGCECSRNDRTWRLDDGYITNKEHLPMTAFTAGDTEDDGEVGYHTIGPLLCW